MPWSSMFILAIDQTVPANSAEEVGFAPVLTICIDVLLGRDEHTTRTAARVIDVMFEGWLQKANHHTDDGTRGIKFPSLLAGGIRELPDKIFICGTQKIGKLEVLIEKANFAEVVDQLTELLITDLTLPDLSGEIDMVEDSFERNILGFDASKGLIELVPNVFMSFIN